MAITFFWSSYSSKERCEAGVGFAIKSHLACSLPKLPQGVNDHLMTLKLPLSRKKSATLISAYAPTMTNRDDLKDKFYEELDALISAVPKSEKLLVTLMPEWGQTIKCGKGLLESMA